ncbi:MAG: hypothetical protein GY938_31855 [Ketobacter sp.]|nr:hypothetical protein [Ketobacter sp.]
MRKIAAATGLSKDSVARSLEAVSKRNKYPESQFWETEAGQAWLCLLVVGMLYVFGLKGNQGAERMSEFLKLIRVNSHVGVSPSALRAMMSKMEGLLVEFGRMQEEKQRQKGEARGEIVGSGDETWFNGQMLLVLMDLGSGYVVMEEEAEDRSYETWDVKAQSRLQQLGLTVRHFVSDRGKALVKLATSSFGCLAGADIFHAQYDISKWLGRSLHGQLGRASKRLKEAEEKMASLKEKKTVPEKIAQQKQVIEQCQEQLQVIEAGRQAYHQAQRSVSAAVHAFSVEENTPQSSEQVEIRLEEQAQRFEQIAQEQSVPDNKDAAGKFRRQIKDVASIVDAWWLWTKESLENGLGAELRYWLLHILLPVIYWHHQLHKTQNPEMKKLYEAALRQAQAVYAIHPVTQTMSKDDLACWQSWAEWASGNFHRASSAVEGRNGCLSQSYHNGRGLTSRRLAALTTIHNYDTRRRDGSTPAERLYEEQFPDLFEWLLGQMGALPLPRKARLPVVHDPLAVNAVSA